MCKEEPDLESSRNPGILLSNELNYSTRRINILENTIECQRMQINQVLGADMILCKAHVTYEGNDKTSSYSDGEESKIE